MDSEVTRKALEIVGAGGPYRVIEADPPWKFSGGTKGRPQHYRRMTPAELLAMGKAVRALRHPEGARCFLWVTRPHLITGLDVLKAWGFRYSTCRVWGKLWEREKGLFIYTDSMARGTGYEVVENADILLIGKYRRPPAISTKLKPPALFHAPRREHSRKPDSFYDHLVEAFDGPRLSMFSRTLRPGFDVCGDEVGKFKTEGAHHGEGTGSTEAARAAAGIEEQAQG